MMGRDRCATAEAGAESRLNTMLMGLNGLHSALEEKAAAIAQEAKDLELARLQGENTLAERVLSPFPSPLQL